MKTPDTEKRQQRQNRNYNKKSTIIPVVNMKTKTKNDIDKVIFVAHQPVRVLSVGKHN
jgi:hypothetical protein